MIKYKIYIKSITKISILFVSLIISGSSIYSQQLRQLSQSNNDRIARLEELSQLYINSGDFLNAISSLNQITYIYWENGRPDKAVESFLRTAPLYEKINDFENLAKLYSNVGLIYLDLEDLNGADRSFSKNLETNRKLGNQRGIATALVDFAYVKNLKKEHREAIALLEEALDLALKINYESILPVIYNLLSNNYTSIGNIKLGEEYRKKYNDIREFLARQTMRGEFQQREQQSQVEIMKSHAEARARELEIKINQLIFQEKQDSIFIIVRAKEDSLVKSRQRDSLQRQNILLLEQESKLQEAEIERQFAVQNFQLLIIYAGAAFIILFLVLIIIVYSGYKTKQKINLKLEFRNAEIQHTNEKLEVALEKIEEQNYRITQSITYAREIQRALFFPIDNLKHYIPESFIFFQPVDLVSGDFYWFKEIGLASNDEDIAVPEHTIHADNADTSNNRGFLPIKGDKFIVTAVDCTGHGVPGAFMSMIGYNLLDSITKSGVTNANKILEKLNIGVRKTLNQEEGKNQDGMDISMCVIDKHSRTVEFAGANNPVIYIQNKVATLIKGDRMPIGGSQKVKERFYTSHIINVDQPTSFYILSDGFTDQFGGETGRKFLLKNFVDLVESIHDRPMEEQKSLLSDVFLEWRGKEPQIDDVVVIGFKLG
ncbi:MAG: SpoIIE family protein phosphatase [Bacteroidetes bacterium]|nr:SpoIIE family protein phosphatase [Bacteroidota bacterium]